MLNCHKATGSSTLKCVLSGKCGDVHLEHTLQTDLRNLKAETFEFEDMPIHRLAAKAQIKELEDDEGKATV